MATVVKSLDEKIVKPANPARKARPDLLTAQSSLARQWRKSVFGHTKYMWNAGE